MEFLFRASPAILYKFLTTPSCLIRWYCEEADIQDDLLTFTWGGADEVAEILESVENELFKLRWEEAEGEEEYLEFRISKSPVTSETILEITDYCDADETDDQRQLWQSQMERLRQETGG